MAHGTSKQTKVGFRLPLDVYEIVERRLAGRRGRWDSVAAYLQERVIYDIRREHEKGKSSDVHLTDDKDFYKRRLGARDTRFKKPKEGKVGQV